MHAYLFAALLPIVVLSVVLFVLLARTMRRRDHRAFMARALAVPVRIASLVLAYLGISMHPAFATSACTANGGAGSNANDIFNLSQYICGFNGVLTGPFAQLIAIIALLGGAWMFFENREMHHGFRNLGVLVVAIGIIIAIPNIMTKVSGVLL